MFRALFSLLLALGSLIAQANSHPDPATLRSLAEHPYWIALGHYEKPLIGGWRSYVDDPDFFLSERGEHSPLAELEATLEALHADPGLADQHAQCRYPSRSEERRVGKECSSWWWA